MNLSPLGSKYRNKDEIHMCLIIKKPQGVLIPDWIVNSAYRRNNDGFGLMAYNTARNKPVMRKWLHRTPTQIMAILDEYKDEEIAIHFRMATHGKVSQELAHPFRLSDNSLLMHNGILSSYCPKISDGTVSDTTEFCRRFMNERIEANKAYLATIDSEREINKAIGNSNKLAIMHVNGKLQLYGANWFEYEGLEFSNSYAWDCPVYAKTSFTSSWETDEYAELDYPNKPYADSYSVMEAIGNEVLEVLYIYIDSLDFSNMSLFSTSDMILSDEFANGTLTATEILNESDEYSLLNMYKALARQGII